MDEDFRKRGQPVAVMLAEVMRGAAGPTPSTAVSECVREIDANVQENGHVVKRIGDAILAVFETVEKAIEAAVAVQHGLDVPAVRLSTNDLQARIGIGRGHMTLEGDDVLSEALNGVMRLTAMAAPGEIFLSGDARAALGEERQGFTRLMREGTPAASAYEYVWREDSLTIRSFTYKRTGLVSLEVRVGERRFVVGRERARLRIGRTADNDVTINQKDVSRHHAELAFRDDKFTILDRSTNGTFLYPDGGEMFVLRREEMTLAGSGHFFVGSEGTEPIYYRVRGVI